MTVAGTWVWVGDMDELLRLLPATGTITKRVPVSPNANGIGVASDNTGDVLVDGEGRETAFVQRRNPRDGTLLKQSASIQSISRPYVGGIDKNSVWVSNTGAMPAMWSDSPWRPSSRLLSPGHNHTRA